MPKIGFKGKITDTSISEEPDFVKGMPTRLTLVRKFANGESHTAFYRKMVKKSKEKDDENKRDNIS